MSKRYLVLQMQRRDSDRAYQMAVVEEASRIPCFKTGTAPYWIPALEPDSFVEQADLLRVLRELCLEHTSWMSLRVHGYVPGDAALDFSERLLREAGFGACGRQAPEKTRIIDLMPPIEEVLAGFPAKIRTKLKVKKPEEVRVDALKSRKHIPALRASLNDSFDRSTAQEHSYDFDGLFDILDASPEAAAAFGLFLSDDWNSPKAFITGVGSPPLFEYAVAGSLSNDRLRQLPFNYILLWRLIEAAKTRGATTFDMGGITDGGTGDPLAGISDFKRRFPGFETSVGREMLLKLRPLRCRLHELLRMRKNRS
jgi:hypothetical protein